MSNVSFVGGVFKLDLNVKNNSTSAYVPLVELNVVKITSGSGTVSVKNADNAGNGKTATSPALFGYSNLLGADQQFAPAEITGIRTLEFNDLCGDVQLRCLRHRLSAGSSGWRRTASGRRRSRSRDRRRRWYRTFGELEYEGAAHNG